MCRFQEIIPCCKVLYHPRASHTYMVTPPRLANIPTQGRHAQMIPEASVGWRGYALLQRYRVCALRKRFPPALIHMLLSARKTGIKRRKVNMEKIQGRKELWVKRHIISGTSAGFFCGGPGACRRGVFCIKLNPLIDQEIRCCFSAYFTSKITQG